MLHGIFAPILDLKLKILLSESWRNFYLIIGHTVYRLHIASPRKRHFMETPTRNLAKLIYYMSRDKSDEKVSL